MAEANDPQIDALVKPCNVKANLIKPAASFIFWTALAIVVCGISIERRYNSDDAVLRQAMLLYTQKHYARAAALFLRAADKGNARAQSNVGVCYYNGTGLDQN